VAPPLQGRFKLFRVQGFGQEIVHPCIQAILAITLQGMGGQGDQWQSREPGI
jgi:hypothetical protein